MPQFKEKGCLKIGSIVLIQEDNVRRLDWVLGKIVELFPGSDGRIRTAKVKTPKGTLIRTVQRLHKLEFLDPVENVDKSEPGLGGNLEGSDSQGSAVNTDGTNVSKFGRNRKPVSKMNL